MGAEVNHIVALAELSMGILGNKETPWHWPWHWGNAWVFQSLTVQYKTESME